jgi:hypothetical protein
MYDVLASRNYIYDSSISLGKPTRPYKTGEGLWEFPLARIPYNGDTKSPLISMDYNFFVRQTGAKEILTRGTPEWDRYYNETLQSFMDYFNKQYEWERIPVLMANHFSLWNDGLYWDVMKQFAYNVCGEPYVKCATFDEVISDLEAGLTN